MKRVLALQPASYRPHAIHQPGRIWAETNCYMDVWIELLHALGRDPVASFAFTFTIDFEGDQWTFFKCPLGDLHELYGIDVQELALWRPLAEHVEEQVGRGRPVLVEVDSHFLPDTAGTAYRTHHTKTTIAVVEIDLPGRRMGYFHNQGYYHVDGEDWACLLRHGQAVDGPDLAPYVEFVKLPQDPEPSTELRERSLTLLRRHLQRVPGTNPFVPFKARLAGDLDRLRAGGLEEFHRYSFATLRQYGACFELSHTYLRWLAGQGEAGLDEAIVDFGAISEATKVFQFQLARAITRGGDLELGSLDAMAERWTRAIGLLRGRYC